MAGGRDLGSSEFRSNLGAVTQAKKRATLEYCLTEPIAPGQPQRFGDCPLAVLEAKHIRVLRDRKTEAPMANHRLMALGSLFRWAVQHNHLRHNPAVGVQRLRITSQGHRTWTDEERETYKARHPIGTMGRLAFELFFETGQRVGDVRAFGPQNVTPDGKLVVRAGEEPRS